ATTSTPIQLTLLRQADLILIDLAELGSLIPRSETHVDDAFLRELAAETAHLAQAARAGGGAAPRALERVGGLVFSHLLTEPARQRLRAAAGPPDLYLPLRGDPPPGGWPRQPGPPTSTCGSTSNSSTCPGSCATTAATSS